NGGYYPTTWNWSALVVAWVVAVVLSVRDALRLGRLELVTIGALFALVGWVALSGLWTESLPSTVREVERDVLYPIAVLAPAAVFGRRSRRRLLAAVCAAITLVSWYALATRIFPDRIGTFESVAGYRLFRPLGYWNALGIFAAIGMLLALAFAARGRNLGTRSVASASLVVLAPTVYFTYSRGAWIALAIGLVTAIALDARRLQLITTTLVAAAAPTAAVLVASQLRGLTHLNSSLARATHDGHRLAFVLLVLAVVGAALMWAQTRIEMSVSVPPAIRRAYVAALVVALAALLSVVVARYGSPQAIARKAWNQLSNPVAQMQGTNLNSRLFSLSAVAAGAYVAFLVHAGIDWDWEVTAVTLAGLLCGVALLIAARRDETILRLGRPRHALVGPAVAVALFSAVGLLGNIPASSAG